MENYGISEAAKILKVTDKTIRNYINRGFLKPEKWNGTWRISRDEVQEIFRKKFGKEMRENPIDISHNPDQILVEKSEFEAQQQQLGKLAAIETVERELRAEIRSINERNAQLEASSASGWTEARALKEELEKTREELNMVKEQEKKAEQDANWLRRQQEEVEITAQKSAETIQKLREENQRLSDLLYQRALGLAHADVRDQHHKHQ
ncbi:MAG: helix-turn-helix domain-containing protein [Gemmatimonadetes bacterium]|nr:helix-turn-helix domain-containing protein [Gemmatimonadota bacterium]